MFGDNLKRIRKSKGLTQAELANKIQVSQSAVGMYEQNRREPDPQLVSKICKVLNISIKELLDVNKPGFVFYFFDEESEAKDSELSTSNISIKKEKSLHEFMDDANALFMNASEDDRDQLYRALSEIYFDSKAKNKEKYNPKKNKEK